MEEGPSLLGQASTSAIADFIVWVLPLPALYRARLPLAQRLALILLFSFGAVVVLAACIRAYWIHYVVRETYDVTWYGFHLWMWTAVEVHLGIICGCVPWLKSLFNIWKSGRQAVNEVSDKSGSGGTPGKRSRPRSGSAGQMSSQSKDETLIRMETLNVVEVEGEVGDEADECERERVVEKESQSGSEEWVDLERCVSNNFDGGLTAPPARNTVPGLAI